MYVPSEEVSVLDKLCKAFGLYVYTARMSYDPSLAVWSIILSLILLLTSSGVAYFFFFFSQDDWIKISTNQILYTVQVISQMCCITIHVYRMLRSQRTYMHLYKYVNQSGKNIYRDVLTYTGIATIVGLYVFCYFTNSEYLYQLSWFMLLYRDFLVYLVLMQFCSLLNDISNSFDACTSNQKKKRFMIATHNELLEICTQINDVFSWQLFFICFLVLNNIISYMYYAVNDLISGVFSLSGVQNVLYSIFFMYELLCLTSGCNMAQKSAEAFNTELFKLMRESKELCSNDKLHLYVTMKQTVNFTACGFFSLGYPLVTSIIAAATTYLVILVQFSLPSKDG